MGFIIFQQVSHFQDVKIPNFRSTANNADLVVYKKFSQKEQSSDRKVW